jgi:hypothetical protein
MAHACRFHTFDSKPLDIQLTHVNGRVCVRAGSDKKHSTPLKQGDEIIAINGRPVQVYVDSDREIAAISKRMENLPLPIAVEFLAKDPTPPYISLCWVGPLLHIRIPDHAVVHDATSKKMVVYYKITLKAPAYMRTGAIFTTQKRYSEFRAMKQKLAHHLPRLHDCLPPFPSRDINKDKSKADKEKGGKEKSRQVSRQASMLVDPEEVIDEDEEGLLRRQNALEAYMQGLDRVCTEDSSVNGE